MKHYKIIVRFTLGFLGLAFLPSMSSAQDSKPAREVGLQFNTVDLSGGGFSAFYKKQKKENVYRRIRFFSGSFSLGVANEEFNFSVSAGAAMGREKRKALDSKLVFYQGPEFSASFKVTSLNETESQVYIIPGFGWVLGLQHSFNDRWAVNMETTPNVSVYFYANTNNEDYRLLSINGDFSNTVSLGLVRKF